MNAVAPNPVDTNDNTGRAFVFAGGGTGGHIYPALAIIEQLRLIDPDVDVHILCSNRAIDDRILSNEDVAFSSIPAMPVSSKPKGLMRFLMSWGPSVRMTRAQIRKFKSNHAQVVLVAMGGFVAAPASRAGRVERVPVALVNLDAVPGKANVLISKRASIVWTSASVQGFDSWNRVKPIVRTQTMGSISKRDARLKFKLDPDCKTLLITGGSQGAASINAFVQQMLIHHPQSFVGWQVIHQVGTQIAETQIDEIRDAYRGVGVDAWVERYIEKMGEALGASDLGVGRCGAGSVAECWAAKLPCVFFPYPYHQDEHQKHNAQVLVDAGTALVLNDQIDGVKNLEAHGESMAQVLESEDVRAKMRNGFDTLGAPDGAAQIATRLMGL